MGKACFIVSSIGEEGSMTRSIADEKYDLVFEPILTELGYTPIRADKETIPNLISRAIVNHIIKSNLVLVDISENNPNVFYELAVRNAVKKPVIIIKKIEQKLPFDIQDVRSLSIDMSNNRQWNEAKNKLIEYVKAAEKNPEKASESILSDFEFAINSEPLDKNTDIIIRLKDIKDSINGLSTKVDRARFSGNNLLPGIVDPFMVREFGTTDFITIDSRPLLGNRGKVVSVDYRIPNVNLLLDRIYMEMLYPSIDPYTYLSKWILIDKDSNKLFDNIGDRSIFITNQYESTESKYDNRTLKEVGIYPGTNLMITKP